MHDLVTPDSYAELSPLYKAIYARNDHGFNLLHNFLQQAHSNGYQFDIINQLAAELHAQ
jgi:hypothetical protein